MRILQFTAENFKKIRVVEIVPKGRLTTITGRNGQGKTSVLDAMWALFGGKRAIPEKPVRKGADKSRLAATLSDDEGRAFLIARRTIAGDRTTTLMIEAAPGATRPSGTPQAVLDALIGEMSFDPIAFITMEPASQIELLRAAVKIDIDFDAIAAATTQEYEERKLVNRRVAELKAQLAAAIYSPGLPAEKVDESSILAKISAAGEENKQIGTRISAKAHFLEKMRDAQREEIKNDHFLAAQHEKIEELKSQLDKAKQDLKAGQATKQTLKAAVLAAEDAWRNAPAGELININGLMTELETARLTNREIDKRTRAKELEQVALEEERKAARLTRSMEVREENKRAAMKDVVMPIEGLAFDEQGVFLRGIPLRQLGEAEQIRVGCALAMAASPKLRCVPIAHGESLDEESLALIEKMAEENDFQIFMARVDSSGKVGIVLEDGLVKQVNP